jgi:hypothetical protein
MRILTGIPRRRAKNGVPAKAHPTEGSKQNPAVMLYQVLQMWQLDDGVQFIWFILATVESLWFGRSILPNTW